MPKTKSALMRYIIIDRCLHNKIGGCSLLDLKKACDNALDDDISIRTIQNDLEFLQSSDGFNAEIDFVWDDRKKYFTYRDKHFTIFQRPFNEEEKQYLAQIFEIISRFEGIPGKDWLYVLKEEVEGKTFESKNVVIEFEQNQDLKNIDLLQTLYDAITNHTVLNLYYEPYGKKKKLFSVSPCYLKQYNSRWFLFAKNNATGFLENFPVDRIVSIKQKQKEKYVECSVDFQDYFSDIIGVSHYNKAQEEKIIFAVRKSRYPFVETKPLHATQKKIRNACYEKFPNTEFEFISICVYPNHELINLILSFGHDLFVIEPQSLKKQIKQILTEQIEKY